MVQIKLVNGINKNQGFHSNTSELLARSRESHDSLHNFSHHKSQLNSRIDEIHIMRLMLINLIAVVWLKFEPNEIEETKPELAISQ